MVAGALMVPATAQAGSVVYDELSDFVFNGFSQGLGACQFEDVCSAVAANRTGLSRAFDGGTATGQFHSLGVYGFATFGTADSQSLVDLFTLESTFGGNGGPTWPERLGLFFSNGVNAANIATWSADLLAEAGAISNPGLADFAGGAGASMAQVDGSDLAALLRANILPDGVLGAVLSNDESSGFDIETAAGVSVIGSDIGSNGWRFDVDVALDVFGNYSYLTLIDLTMSDSPDFWVGRSGDGWDLAELRATSVPEPGTVALLSAGLLGIGVARRRRAA